MKKYTKPSIAKVNLTAKEQVLEYCKTSSGVAGETPCHDPNGTPLLEIYGPILP